MTILHVAAVLLLLPTIIHAATLVLTWDYDRTAPPTAFLITYTDGTTTAQMTTAPSTPSACAHLPDATADTFCVQWPTCPPPGHYTFTVQAVRDEGPSAATNAAVCVLTAAAPCVCGADEEIPGAPVPQNTGSVATQEMSAPGISPPVVLMATTPSLPVVPPWTPPVGRVPT